MVDFLTKMFGLLVFGIFVVAFVFQSLSINDKQLGAISQQKIPIEQEVRDIEKPKTVLDKPEMLASNSQLVVEQKSNVDLVILQNLQNLRSLLNSGYQVFVMLDNSNLDEKLYLQKKPVLAEVFYIDKMVFTSHGGIKHGEDTAYFVDDFVDAFEKAGRQAVIYN